MTNNSSLWLNEGTDMLSKMKEPKQKETERAEKKAKTAEMKENMQLLFSKCKDVFICDEVTKCAAKDFKMCSVCGNVLRSNCSKAACKIEGEKPAMVLLASCRTDTVMIMSRGRDVILVVRHL